MKIPFFRSYGMTKGAEDFSPIARAGKDDPLYFEQVKALRAKFEYKIDLKKLKIVAVTSAVAGEGKTTSCGQLAMHLVMTGRKKVLLIDTDLRKSDLARGFNITPVPGLSEFLTGASTFNEVVRNSFLPGLYIITAGTRMAEPGHLLSEAKFRSFLEVARNQYDVILLDTPPILPVADTLSLRDQVDGFLFLYRAGFTPHPMLRQAADEVGEEKIIGVILNGVDQQNQKYYARYYGKYYRKAGKEESST